MVDVRGDVLRPPHGTTPAAVTSNKNQKQPLYRVKQDHDVSHMTFLVLILIWVYGNPASTIWWPIISL